MAIYEYSAVFILIFLISLLIYQRWNGTKKTGYRYPPSLPSLPLVGSLPFLRNFNNIPVFFMEKSKKLGPIFSFRVGNKLFLTLNTREAIEEAYVKNLRFFNTREHIYHDKIINPNSKGISFASTTDEWKQRQKTSLSIMREFGFGSKNVMEEKILFEVEAMAEFVKKKNGQSFAPQELFLMMTSNIMSNIMLGHRRDLELGVSPLTHEIDLWVRLLDMVYDVAPFTRYLPPFRRKISDVKESSKRIFKILDEEVTRSLEDKESDCYVHRYVQREGPNFDREQLNFILRDLVAGGIDTTNITLQWLAVVLANQPEVQKRLQKYVDSVIPDDRLPTLQDQANLPYVEATLLELFRWRTLLPLALARATSADCILRDYFVPAGTWVLPNLFAAHSDPDFWEDPDEFRPERFLDKDNNVIGKDRVITFSLGRRSCLGEILARTELFLIITSLVKKFDVLPPEGQNKLNEKIEEPVSLVTHPMSFSIRMIERRL